MPGIEFYLFAFVSLFVIISPISTVPLFLGMTPNNTPHEREGMARFACIVAAPLLMFFALFGELLFRALGITSAAFQTAGGILLFMIALEMTFGKEPTPAATISAEDRAAAARQDDIAITPLAIPMLCGPGSISTAVLLQSKATNVAEVIALMLALVTVLGACYAIFRFAAFGGKWLKPMMLRVARRLMGLLLAAVAVQFVFNGIRASQLLGNLVE
ncbi:MAG: MarC family protein [Puniceicoccales bacterium]